MAGTTWISKGDFIDLFFKVKQKGYFSVLSKFRVTKRGRTKTKWNTATRSSDFWIIPELREHWNFKCTGDSKTEYADYLVSEYLSGFEKLKMLSVGCGSGARERVFGKYSIFESIEGIDLAENKIREARETAAELGFDHIKYRAGDFMQMQFEEGFYDVVLFNSSLHHFNDIFNFLKFKIRPLLKKGGLLVIFEYVGPKRLQWTNQQLKISNLLLQQLPEKFRKRVNSSMLKQRNYRPGILRMLLVDPSEAVDSEAIIPSVRQLFSVVEEKQLGWDILQVLLKDIAHNFLEPDKQTREMIEFLIREEEKFIKENGRSDAVFGIYRKE